MVPTPSETPPPLTPLRPSLTSVSIKSLTFASSFVSVSLASPIFSIVSSPPPSQPQINNVAFHRVLLSSLEATLLSPGGQALANLKLSDVKLRAEQSKTRSLKTEENCTRLSAIVGGGGAKAWREGTGFALSSLVDNVKR